MLYMLGQLAFEGVAGFAVAVVAGVFTVVVLVAALAATAPPKIRAPVTAVVARIFRVRFMLLTSFPRVGTHPFKRTNPGVGAEQCQKPQRLLHGLEGDDQRGAVLIAWPRRLWSGRR